MLVVNTRTVNYDEAIDCCQENFGELIKIDSQEKSTVLYSFLTGLCILYVYLLNIESNKITRPTVERLSREWEVQGSILDRIIIKMFYN